MDKEIILTTLKSLISDRKDSTTFSPRPIFSHNQRHPTSFGALQTNMGGEMGHFGGDRKNDMLIGGFRPYDV